MSEYILEMKHITKRFASVVANEDVNLSVKKGEVHALLGENGAGKSTLMNCLYGMYDSYEGEIWFNGQKVVINDPKQAIALGIGMVHQHFMLIPALTVIENVVLGLKENKQVLDLKAAAERFTELGKRYNMEIDPWVRVEQLSVGQQQRLEILKALYRDAKLLILDEPTAVLTPDEVDGLFDMMNKLTSEGHTVIFISHKLNEIMKICDRCTVLRQGKLAATVEISEVHNRQELANLMVGHQVELKTERKPPEYTGERLRVEHLTCLNDRGLPAVKDVNLSVEPGEFIAILGHNGSGKSTLAKHFNALLLPSEGCIVVDGMDTADENHTWDVRSTAGMVFQNPDNQIIGQVVEEDVGFGPENLGVPTKEIWERVEESLKAVGMYEYRKYSPNKLSGGQKQRVSIAGVLAMHPKCIVLDEPTAMLDPNGRKDVIRAARALNDVENVTIILITHYMEEVIYADRVFVMDEGKVVMQGTPREIFSQVERLKHLRLDVPQVTLLAYELQKSGLKLPDGILTAQELTEELKKLCTGSKTGVSDNRQMPVK